jgi:hypothetical protein
MTKKIINALDYHREIQLEANKNAYECTCHYLKLKDGEPHPHATGIFTNIQNNYFLITAAHVIENQQTEIYVGYDKHKVTRLGGELTINQMTTNEKRVDDKIDIAILKLDDESIGYVKQRYKFLDYSELGINHKTKILPYYSAIGFPASQNKFNKYKNQLNSKPFIFTTMPADDKIYTELNCKKFLNLIVHYDKKKVIEYSTNKTQTGPDPYGISGGGLWYVPTQLVQEGDKVQKKLVGVLTEWPIKNNKYWISTRIDVFTEIIRQKYNLKIDQSKLVKVNL